MKKIKLIFLLSLFIFGCNRAQQISDNKYEADVIIYGGTSGAVAAAVEVAQSGKSGSLLGSKPSELMASWDPQPLNGRL